MAPRPDISHPSAGIKARALGRRRYIGGFCCGCRPDGAIEKAEKPVRNKPRSRGIDVPIAVRVLAMREKARREDEAEFVACLRQRDIEKPSTEGSVAAGWW